MAPKKGRDYGSDPRFNDVVKQMAGSYRTMSQMVLEVIRESIVTGTLAPGEWLRQESLANAIGVSRIPVRNALLQLQAEGLVVFHPHRGARVRSLTIEQLDEIYRLRSLLETYALRLSMPRMTGDRVELLRSLAAQMDAKPEGGEFVDVRVRFYRALYDDDSNPLLVQMIEQLRSSVGRYLLGFRIHGKHVRRHSDLVDTVASGDLLGAEAWLYEHLAAVRHGIESVSEHDSDESDDERGDPELELSAARKVAAAATTEPSHTTKSVNGGRPTKRTRRPRA
jgi:DNA-binding GntR family transcriptional regulator